ncbi:MAG: winged helix-turn-helix transcriptional regulator [Clostridia bacterium]|nr:winged helix-turn-helix transcriptional regulator [Clostridia bacterium]
MARNWTEDDMLVDSITGNMFDALPMLPKRLVRVDAITRRFDMPFSHVQILCMLSSGSMSIGEISRGLGIAKPNITPLLDSMAERKLLERVRSSRDRRIVNVELLPAGVEMAAAIRGVIAEQIAEWQETLSASEAKRLNSALACLISVSRQLPEHK